MLKGFKEFISRGNVVELAVGVIIGAAFKNIVDALVTAVINFLLMAFAIYFCIVVPMNALNARRKKAKDDAPKETSDEVKLLTEIRDALAKGDRA